MKTPYVTAKVKLGKLVLVSLSMYLQTVAQCCFDKLEARSVKNHKNCPEVWWCQ